MADEFDISVRIEINKRNPSNDAWTGERMSINEDFRIGTAGWVQIAEILGRFHGLVETIQTERTAR